MAYTRQWGSTHPGCLIVLLDQSRSMRLPFGSTQLGAGRKKSEMVATVLNNLLHEFVKSNTVGTEIKPRADVAILGYGSEGDQVKSALSGPLASKPFVSLPELMVNPLRIETRTRKEMDDEGHVVEEPIHFPIWVEAVARGKTPMCAALRKAAKLAQEWTAAHPDSYPPVIINVTDGGASDGEPTVLARKLTMVHTDDGHALLFNCHITDKLMPSIEFPDNVSSLPNDKRARLLFSLSSEIPDNARENILRETGQALPSGARGFILNGDAGSVRRMFVFATVAAQVDPNR